MQRILELELFHNSTFRSLWLATLVYNLGGFVQVVGASWLMMLIGSSHYMVGLVQSATTLPHVILALMAGVLADNFNRRKIMLFAQIMMMAVSVHLTILAYMDLITPWGLVFITFLIGCGSAFYNLSWQATVGDIVSRDNISSAVNLNSVGFNVTRSIGPSVGGVIVAALGGFVAFLCSAMAYIPVIIALFLWKTNLKRDGFPREKLFGAMADGLRYVAMSPNLLNLMMRAFLFGVGAISISALLPIFTYKIFKGSALIYGILLGCFGMGAIIAGIINPFVRRNLSSEKIISGAFIGLALSCFFLAMSRSLWISYLVLLPAGLCWVLALSLFNTLIQLSTPRWVVARALALYQMASYGGMAIGSASWGALADRYSPTVSLSLCGVFLILGALAGIKFKIQEIPQINLEQLDQLREPELALDLEARSGPIMIMVTYKVHEKDLAEFLKVMTRRCNIRRRNGARQWVLLRDLDEPDRWTEAYHMPTWIDYLRYRRRHTKADVEVDQHLSQLNCAPKGIRVRRMIERQTVPHVSEMHEKSPPSPLL